MKWRGHWTLFYTDHLTGKQVRKSCAVLKAFTPEARRELVQQYRSQELCEAAEVLQRGGYLAYRTPFLDAIQLYIEEVENRVEVRQSNPRTREGLSVGSGYSIKDTLTRLKEWLKGERLKKLTTGDLDPTVLEQFFQYLTTSRTRKGNRETQRSAATINKHKRNIRAALNFMKTLRPPLFPDPDIFARAVKPSVTDTKNLTAFSAKSLESFLKTALAYEYEGRRVTVERFRNGKKETFTQGAVSYAATPVSRLFILLALTGARRTEVLRLQWSDCDLEKGRLSFHAQKTGRTRILPLVDINQKVVSFKLLELLQKWRKEDPKRVYVLPHGDLRAPTFPKKPWKTVCDDSGLEGMTPQNLRKNFCSYAAALGVPASVAADWQGHSAAVAEKWYRLQVLDGAKGSTFEEAMGLNTTLETLISS